MSATNATLIPVNDSWVYAFVACSPYGKSRMKKAGAAYRNRLNGIKPYDQLKEIASSFIAFGANIKTQVRAKNKFKRKSYVCIHFLKNFRTLIKGVHDGLSYDINIDRLCV